MQETIFQKSRCQAKDGLESEFSPSEILRRTRFSTPHDSANHQATKPHSPSAFVD